MKMRVGSMDGAPAVSAARVKAARATLRPEIEVAVDAHGTSTVAEAKRFAHLTADCDLAWFEEPVSADDTPGMAEVRASVMVPIAAGKSEATRFDFRDLIAGLHGCAAAPASFTFEYSCGANPMIHDILTTPVAARDGMIAIPGGPGLGFSIADSVIAAPAKPT